MKRLYTLLLLLCLWTISHAQSPFSTGADHLTLILFNQEGQQIGKTEIALSADASMDYGDNRDDKAVTGPNQLTTLSTDSVALSFNSIPYFNGQVSIPLTIEGLEEGMYLQMKRATYFAPDLQVYIVDNNKISNIRNTIHSLKGSGEKRLIISTDHLNNIASL